jgi:hypothetical protein
MTILAGIDEAGLGPRLGPLVVSMAALRVGADWDHEEPWVRLAEGFGRAPNRGEVRPAVCDSKILHRVGGVDGLAKTVAAVLGLRDGRMPDGPMTWPALVALFSSDCRTDLFDRIPWFGESLEATGFDGALSAEDAAELRRIVRDAGCEMRELCASVLPARHLNGRFASGLNKHEVVLEQTAGHLRNLVQTYPDEPIRVLIDRQGGRRFYHPLLIRTFPGAWIDILEETRECSAYGLRRSGADVSICFQVRAETAGFCTGLASILSKFLRELAMRRLNEFFATHCPGLRPTAGYPADAERFVREAGPAIESSGVEMDVLVRKR